MGKTPGKVATTLDPKAIRWGRLESGRDRVDTSGVEAAALTRRPVPMPNVGYDGTDYWLIDGAETLALALEAGLPSVEVYIESLCEDDVERHAARLAAWRDEYADEPAVLAQSFFCQTTRLKLPARYRGPRRRAEPPPVAPGRQPAIGYVRVSTDDQAREGVSLDAQRAKVAAWCLANDAPLDPDDIFVEGEAADRKAGRGKSGGRFDNRPALQAALDRVCGCGGTLVFYSLSRLARSTKDTLAIAERIEAAGANMVSLSERIDTTSASGKMVFRLLAVLAEFERDLISERTRGAMRHKKSKGESLGKVPVGWSLGPDGKTLVEDPAGRATLALIGEWADRGWPLRRIAAELDARSIPTRNGRPWSYSTIAHLLKRLRSEPAA